MNGYSIYVQGVVQGVGFRPFIKNLATKLNLKGYVSNTSKGVKIEIISSEDEADNFINELLNNAPAISHILSIEKKQSSIDSVDDFIIKTSNIESGVTLVSSDISVCSKCKDEIDSNKERRYKYPFTNCTNCGPRYSIIKKLPYDRCNTVMDNFLMCDDCQEEYKDSLDRRFHAQPIACPKCGPKIYLNHNGKVIYDNVEALKITANEINKGNIVAVKGLGGYHLICDGHNDSVIQKLRNLKNRQEKPLALMVKNIQVLKKYIDLDEKYISLISSPESPIVICDFKYIPFSKFINPLSNKIGIMVAYTPLHYLLFDYLKNDFIVATSGNLKDEPISISEKDAEENLSIFTNTFLHHNREIYNRVDDSVISITEKDYTIFRRARGFAPYPVVIKSDKKTEIFAAGANLKSTIALYKNNFAFVSQYIGDLDNVETMELYEEIFTRMKKLFNVKPNITLIDYHKNYRSSIFANSLGLETISIQHHIAHFSSCLAENSYYGDAVGIIMDGFGLGLDNEAWGGEFFLKKGKKITRKSYLKKYLQVGLDSASKNPVRMLISYLVSNNLLDKYRYIIQSRIGISDKEVLLVENMCKNNINSILTTSAGRLFEAVGSLVLSKKSNEYEGALAVALENICCNNYEDFYNFTYENNCIDFISVIEQIFIDIEKGIDESIISYKFHKGFANVISIAAKKIALENQVKVIALSGGVFQNITLLNFVIEYLEKENFTVLIHKKVPSNDGGISLGQLYYYLEELEFIDF